jgi:hypothetical protein
VRAIAQRFSALAHLGIHDTDKGRHALAQLGVQPGDSTLADDRTSLGPGPRPSHLQKPGGALVYAANAPDELIESLGSQLVRRRVPQSPAPLAPGSFVGLRRVGGAPE